MCQNLKPSVLITEPTENLGLSILTSEHRSTRQKTLPNLKSVATFQDALTGIQTQAVVETNIGMRYSKHVTDACR